LPAPVVAIDLNDLLIRVRLKNCVRS
jgi:hypothetical protein